MPSFHCLFVSFSFLFSFIFLLCSPSFLADLVADVKLGEVSVIITLYYFLRYLSLFLSPLGTPVSSVVCLFRSCLFIPGSSIRFLSDFLFFALPFCKVLLAYPQGQNFFPRPCPVSVEIQQRRPSRGIHCFSSPALPSDSRVELPICSHVRSALSLDPSAYC